MSKTAKCSLTRAIPGKAGCDCGACVKSGLQEWEQPVRGLVGCSLEDKGQRGLLGPLMGP